MTQVEGQRNVVIPNGHTLPFKVAGTVLFLSVASGLLSYVCGPVTESELFPGFVCDSKYSMALMCLDLKSGLSIARNKGDFFFFL